jgi:hypothetical protein
LIVLSAAVVVPIAVSRVRPVHALAEVSSPLGVETPPEPVGTEVFFGVVGLRALDHHTVQLTSAHVVNVPPGIAEVSVMAAHYGPHGYIGAVDNRPSSVATPGSLPQLYPLSMVRIVPGVDPDWYLLATIRVLRPGRFVTSDIAVAYRAGGRAGQKRYPIQVTVNAIPRA